jgi:protein-disulfide isomerase
MFRRFLVAILRRSIVVLALICLGCSAQSVPQNLTRRIERQVRSSFSIPPETRILVGALKTSEFPNYDALTITFDNGERKQDVNFLLSKDGNTLIRMSRYDLTKDPYEEVMRKIDTKDRPTRGNKDAKVVAINYDDFECPYCSHMHQTLFPTIFKEYGDRVLFIYKDYPLVEIHPWAVHAAVNANCLAAQNNDAYWDFADFIHANQKEVNQQSPPARVTMLDRFTVERGSKYNLDGPKLQACIAAQKEDAVRASMKEATAIGVDATPTLFVNGEKIDGALPLPELRAVFNRALRDAGVSPPPPPAATSSSPPGK